MFASPEILSYDHSQIPIPFYTHQAGMVRAVCCDFFSLVFFLSTEVSPRLMGSRDTLYR